VEAAHAVCHIVKAAGKLAGACDDAGHGRQTHWLTWIADVVISAEGLSSILGFTQKEFDDEYHRRVKEKNT
jgi:hypothetical protein